MGCEVGGNVYLPRLKIKGARYDDNGDLIIITLGFGSRRWIVEVGSFREVTMDDIMKEIHKRVQEGK